MLDFIVVFSKGGVVLWKDKLSIQNVAVFINTLINDVILQERVADFNQFEQNSLTIHYKLDNDLGLVYAAGSQKCMQITYIEVFLHDLSVIFRKYCKENLNYEISSHNIDHEIERALIAAKKSMSIAKASKQMRNFDESRKSSKTASIAKDLEKIKYRKIDMQHNKDDLEKSSLIEPVHIEHKEAKSVKVQCIDMKNRNLTIEKKKADKKPRVWDLGGNAKDAVILDRSKTHPTNFSIQDSHKNIIGTMQGRIQDLGCAESYQPVTTFAHRQSESGVLTYFKNIVKSKTLTKVDLEPALSKMRDHLVSKNVAAEIASKLCDSVAGTLEGRILSNFDSTAALVRNSLTTSLIRILSPKHRIDIIRDALEAKHKSKPYSIIFCGVNGVGKSTNLAKICFWLVENGFSVLIAACDTFRAGAVEQLRTHTRFLNALHPPEKHGRTMVELYEKGYGKDAASIAMEAIKYAFDTKMNIVLIDTAGRMQDNEPLMRSLSKLIKINNPDLVLFVAEALVGNEAVDQLLKFNQSLADFSSEENPHVIDGIVLTKFDTIDDKVGAAISMTYATGHPIVFVGTGQTYNDLRALNVDAVVHSLMN